MSTLYGLEKFSNLEDKIYRMVEQFKRERERRAALERDVTALKRELNQLVAGKEHSDAQIERLLSERDAIKLKVEAMLDAISVIDPEAADILKR